MRRGRRKQGIGRRGTLRGSSDDGRFSYGSLMIDDCVYGRISMECGDLKRRGVAGALHACSRESGCLL